MDETGAVVAVIDALNAAAIPFILVGSLSSNAYGIPRSTKDAVLVLQLGSKPLGKIMQFLPQQFRLDPQIGFETITSTTRSRIFCDLEPVTFSIELFELSDDPHDQLRFARRIPTVFGGSNAFLPTPEDVVVTKLRWGITGGSRQKDIDDVRNVLSVQQGKLDLPYIRQWCDQHSTRDLLEQTLHSIPPLPDAT